MKNECLLCEEGIGNPYVCLSCYTDKVIEKKAKHKANYEFYKENCKSKLETWHTRELILAYVLFGKGLKCDWQKKIDYKTENTEGSKRIDIFIESANLHIEVDGEHHQNDPAQIRSDMWRTYYAQIDGCLTLRVPNGAFAEKEKFLYVANEIKAIANKRRRAIELEQQKKQKKWWQFWK